MRAGTPSTRLRLCLAVAGSTLLIAATGALAAVPAKKTAFTGTASGKVKFATTFTAKVPLAFSSSSDGKALEHLAFTDSVCGFAASKLVKVGTVKVSPSGAFSLTGHASAPVPDALQDGHKVVVTTTISGSFQTPTKATGTLTYTDTEPGTASRCGPIVLRFTATAS